MLIHLIADYTRSAELRERFRSNPALVLDWYEISQEDRDALRAQGLEEWARRAHRELDGLLSQESSAGPYEMVWTWEYGKDFRFSPDQGEVGESSVTLVAVRSERFQSGSSVEFRMGRHTVEASEVSQDPSGRRMQVRVTLHRTGDYYIVVRQPDGPDLTSDRPFTVTGR